MLIPDTRKQGERTKLSQEIQQALPNFTGGPDLGSVGNFLAFPLISCHSTSMLRLEGLFVVLVYLNCCVPGQTGDPSEEPTPALQQMM